MSPFSFSIVEILRVLRLRGEGIDERLLCRSSTLRNRSPKVKVVGHMTSCRFWETLYSPPTFLIFLASEPIIYITAQDTEATADVIDLILYMIKKSLLSEPTEVHVRK